MYRSALLAFSTSLLTVNLVAQSPIAGSHPDTPPLATRAAAPAVTTSTGGPLSNAASVTLPKANTSNWGNGNNAIPFTTGPGRYQQVFAGSEMPAKMNIQSIAFRRDEQFSGYDGSAVEVEILLGYTKFDHTTLTTSYMANANSGALQTVVGRRKILLKDMPGTPPINPQAWFLRICFDKPFAWTQQAGRNLLVEIRIHNNSNNNIGWWYQFDFASNATTSRLFTRHLPDSPTGIVNTGGGLVMQFDETKCVNDTPAYYETYGAGCEGTGGKPGHIVPKKARTRFLNARSGSPFNSRQRRWQQEIDASQMPSKTMTFTSIAQRKDEFNGTHGQNFITLKVLFGMTTYNKDTLTTDFAKNATGAQTTVFDGNIFWPSTVALPRRLHDWRFELKLKKPFLYIPRQGQNFLVEYVNTTASRGSDTSFDTERGESGVAGGSFVQALDNPTATVGNLVSDTVVATLFGTPGSAGSATPRIDNFQRPVLGNKTFRIDLLDARPKSVALLVLGFSKTKWSGATLPLNLKPLGAPDCDLLVSYDLAFGVPTDATGTGSATLPIPNDRRLQGQQFHNQFAVLDKGANAFGFAWSNGATATISNK